MSPESIIKLLIEFLDDVCPLEAGGFNVCTGSCKRAGTTLNCWNAVVYKLSKEDDVNE